jgi:ATP-dependent RNA helicase DeaD
MSEPIIDFASLGLPGPLMAAVSDVGYEEPSPIQAQAIPALLAGSDLIGQAQTGTGKTAAFALPLLARIDASASYPQLMVLAPTRELALQVAEAMQTYARFLPGFHVLPIYGGQGMGMQLSQLRRGVQVVVGTPGRVMDHMRRGSLDISRLQSLVLDEADEMLRMGFIDDVDWILEHTPPTRQIALFSATMPNEIRRVAERHLNEPQHIKVASKTTTAENIRQRYWSIGGLHKLDALTRILESESFDGVIIFVRTKTQTVELAEKLSARGFAAEALNGDVAQVQRERTVGRLRDGKLDILVATDVAARGLDVRRVTHVINYDIPHDTESYVHRIGRTGRAGAAGEAILFVAPRERRMLRSIEKATGHPIEPMELPSVHDINSKRTERFKDSVREVIAKDELALYYRLVSELEQEDDLDALQIAAALASLAQGDVPLLLDPKAESQRGPKGNLESHDRGTKTRPPERSRAHPQKVVETEALPLKDFPEIEMERFRVAVGYQHGVKPGNIVGAIANEAELESKYIGHIEIFDDFSTVDLPAGMPPQTMRQLRNAWVCQQKLAIERLKGASSAAKPGKDKAEKSKHMIKRAEVESGHKRRQRPVGEAASTSEKSQADNSNLGGSKGGAPRKDAKVRAGKPAVGEAQGKASAKRPRSKPVGFKGNKKPKAAGNKPLKKRLSLKKGPGGGA